MLLAAHLYDWTHAFLAGSSVSHTATFLESWLWPAVASTEELPPWNTRSAVLRPWVCSVKYGEEVLAACHSAELPSPSHTPNLFPCCVNTILFTLANIPACLTLATWVSQVTVTHSTADP